MGRTHQSDTTLPIARGVFLSQTSNKEIGSIKAEKSVDEAVRVGVGVGVDGTVKTLLRIPHRIPRSN